MNKYILGITVGPIFETLAQARKTRELWAASYTFSYLVKNLLATLNSLNGRVILPAHESDPAAANYGGGSYPDRIIMECQEEQPETLITKVEQIKEDLIVDFALQVANHLGANVKQVVTSFKQYFQIHTVVLPHQSGSKILSEMNRALDSAEQCQWIAPNTDLRYFGQFFKKINRSFLTREAYGKAKRFPSLIEIATAELADRDGYAAAIKDVLNRDEDDDEAVLKGLEDQLNIKLANYHSYIAIVHADGDNIGKTIEGVEGEKVIAFSKAMQQFGKHAFQTIHDFGGEPIYVGGDDLLFFAPIVGKGNLFDLCQQLDNLFNKQLQNLDSSNQYSLSFGVSIHYYKFPMYEMLEESRNLLFSKAKKFNPGVKNNITFKITKHSGQTFGATINLRSKVMGKFGALQQASMNKPSESLLSLGYKLYELAPLLALTVHADDGEQRVAELFNNYLNEDIHVDKKTYIKYVSDFCLDVYKAQGQFDESPKLIVDSFFRTLRFLA